MSAAEHLDSSSAFEELVTAGLRGTRQGAVIVVESYGVPEQRLRWLSRQLEQLIPGAPVHELGGGLFLAVLRHAGPAETWLLVERMKRQLAKSGWDRTTVGAAMWPVQGSSATDVVAAALASLYDERERAERERVQRELWFPLDEEVGFSWASASELLTG